MGGGCSPYPETATDGRATVTHVPARGKDSHFRERSITEPTRIRSKHVRPDRGFVHNEDLKGAVVEAWQEKAGFTVDDRPFETASFHTEAMQRARLDLVLEYYCFKGIILKKVATTSPGFREARSERELI